MDAMSSQCEPKCIKKSHSARFAIARPGGFFRVHDVIGVDRLFDCAHDAHCLAVLGDQEVEFAAARCRARRCRCHRVTSARWTSRWLSLCGLRHLLRLVGIKHEADVKIAVARHRPTIGAGRKDDERSFCVSVMHSASREIGTQTSVTQSWGPALAQCLIGVDYVVRTRQRLRRSSGLVAQEKSVPP